MNRKTILANFKMNKTNAQIAEYFDGLLPQLKDTKAQVVVCVPDKPVIDQAKLDSTSQPSKITTESFFIRPTKIPK